MAGDKLCEKIMSVYFWFLPVLSLTLNEVQIKHNFQKNGSLYKLVHAINIELIGTYNVHLKHFDTVNIK
jgi:hypothetical protein